MKFLFRMLSLLALTVLVWLVITASTSPAPVVQDAGTSPLSTADIVTAGAISAAVGWIISYVLNTFAWLRDAFDKVPSSNKPVLLAILYVAGAVVLGQLTCYAIYISEVTCPAAPTDYVKLVFLGLVAWVSSQTAHVTGGKALAATARYKASAPVAPPASAPPVKAKG